MAVDMLLIDGGGGELSQFIIPVINLIPSFKFGDASVAIRFTDQTVFLKIQKQLNLFRLRVSMKQSSASVLDGLAIAKLLDEMLIASGVEPKVLLSTTVNPKLVGALEEKSLNKLHIDTRELSMGKPHF
ncbi:hypothetical protein YC2023_063820 [Brassica napus]